jgi:hypothetical protein
MDYTNGIKLEDANVPAKAIMEIRKATGLAMSDIKNRAANGELLMECDLADDQGLATMIGLAKKLDKLGVKTSFMYNGEPEDLQFMENLQQTYGLMDEQLGIDDDE